MSIPVGTNRTRLQGAAGNLRVASELLLQGLNVSIPIVDMGVDVEVESTVRIQVKSAHLSKDKRHANSGPSYCFFLARGPKALGKGKSSPMVAREFSKVCDFVVLWGIEQSRFWIVPAVLLDGRYNVTLGLSARWVRTDDQEIKRLYDSGMKQEEVAAALGLSIMTVSRRRRGMFIKPPEFMGDMVKIRECEGRWDHIHAYLRTMKEVESVTNEVVVPSRSPLA